MESKAEQLRAMREAKAQSVVAEKVPESLKPKPAPKKTFSEGGWGTKKRVKAKPKAKNGSGKRFVPNKTKGRPNADKAHLTNEARKPWEAMKISRRTWYRRLAKEVTISKR